MGENVPKKVENPVLHVLVVGFHHKKGCQVEYSFPPLVPGTDPENNECPPGWKYLPTLALPDGSHNYDQDTVYFHLPSLTDPDKTVFGISCFRQIPVEKLKNKTADITRGTVQKSVCVLSSVPLYGHIQVKMSLITHAYFEEGDFTKVSLLKDTYHHLNACLNQIDDLQNASQLFVGLSGRDLILQWRHKAVLLFKLLLLEKKVIFYRSPVQPLCATILSLLSLHPGMMENGLYNSACVQPSRPMSPVPQFVNTNKNDKETPVPINKIIETVDSSINHSKEISPNKTENITSNLKQNEEEKCDEMKKCTVDIACDEDLIFINNNGLINNVIDSDKKINLDCDNNCENQVDFKNSCQVSNGFSEIIQPSDNPDKTLSDTDKIVNNIDMIVDYSDTKVNNTENGLDNIVINTDKISDNCSVNSLDRISDKIIVNSVKCMDNFTNIDEEGKDVLKLCGKEMDLENVNSHDFDDDGSGDNIDEGNITLNSLPRDISVETLGETTAQNNMVLISQINAQLCGIPLPIFTQGYLCMPYLSLPYMDLLTDKNVRGYVVGATNVLFKQKKRLADVLIEVDGARIETSDVELRRLLHLTTEDLRFADFLVKHVAEERHDVFLDGVGWEGGDEWIRAQFRVYLLCLLRTSLLQEGSRELDHFNSAFISAWRQTASYKAWFENAASRDGILEINPGHPFSGQLSVADMKLRLAHTMQNTEGGRKLNQAVLSTGRAVATTGRAVGGALSHAKGALSSWWSNLTTAQSPTDTNNLSSTQNSIPDEQFQESSQPTQQENTQLQQDSMMNNVPKPPASSTNTKHSIIEV